MRTLKFSVLLPIPGLVVAVVLLEWAYRAPSPFPLRGDELYVPTPRMVCLGINAPAWPLTLLLSVLPLPGMKLFLLQTEDFEFLGGLIVVWYLAGKLLDHRAARQKLEPAGMPVGTVFWNLLLMAWGIGLFVMAMAPLRSAPRYNNPGGNITEGILFLAWSLVLIVFPALQLLRALGARQSDPESAGK
jgi:hypothetical protein